MTLSVDWRFGKDWGVTSFRETVVVRLAVDPAPDAEPETETEGPRPEVIVNVASVGRTRSTTSVDLFAPGPDDDEIWRTRAIEIRPGWILPSRIRLTARHAKLGREEHRCAVWIIPRLSVVLSVVAIVLCGLAVFLRLLFLLRTLNFTAADAGIGLGGAFIAVIVVWVRSLSGRARESWTLPELGVGLMLGRTMLALAVAGIMLEVGASYVARDWLIAFVNETDGPIDLPHALEGKLSLPPHRYVTVTGSSRDLLCAPKEKNSCPDLVRIIQRIPDASARYCFAAGEVPAQDDKLTKLEWWTLTKDGKRVEECTPADRSREGSDDRSVAAGPIRFALTPKRVVLQCRERVWKELSSILHDDVGDSGDRWFLFPDVPAEHDEGSGTLFSEQLYPCKGSDGELCLRMKTGCEAPEDYWAWIRQGDTQRLVRAGHEAEQPKFSAILDVTTNAGLKDVELWRLDPEGREVTHRFGPFGGHANASLKVPATPTSFEVDLIQATIDVDPRIPRQFQMGRLRCSSEGQSGRTVIGKFNLFPLRFEDSGRGLLRVAMFRDGHAWSSVWENVSFGRRPSTGHAYVCERYNNRADRLAMVLSPTADKGAELEIPAELEVPAELKISAKNASPWLTVEVYRETSNPDAPNLVGTSVCPETEPEDQHNLQVVPIDDSEGLRELSLDGIVNWSRHGPGQAYACVDLAADVPDKARGTTVVRGARRRAKIWFAEQRIKFASTKKICRIDEGGEIAYRKKPGCRRLFGEELAKFRGVNSSEVCDEVYDCRRARRGRSR